MCWMVCQGPAVPCYVIGPTAQSDPEPYGSGLTVHSTPMFGVMGCQTNGPTLGPPILLMLHKIPWPNQSDEDGYLKFISASFLEQIKVEISTFPLQNKPQERVDWLTASTKRHFIDFIEKMVFKANLPEQGSQNLVVMIARWLNDGWYWDTEVTEDDFQEEKLISR